MIGSAKASATFIRHASEFKSGELLPTLEELGGKGRALAVLSAIMPVPDWFALTPAAFGASLTPQLRDMLRSGNTESALAEIAPSAEVQRQLQFAIDMLCHDGERVAVRSSATDEDSAQFSFAGQLESFLFVAPDQVAARVADVWRSAFSERAMAYRRERGAGAPGAGAVGANAPGASAIAGAPAVIVQRMVDADVSGVAFSADPVSGRRDVAVVAALYGLGTALVSGESDADTYHVAISGEIVERQICAKRSAHRAMPGMGEGVAAVPVPNDLASRPALTDEQIRRVASLARSAERHFDAPQDVEWALEGDDLYLLQSRPITTLAAASERGELNLWDNSNIAVSYGGVTTPLTFSFARHAYEGAYRQFCRLMRVPEATIAAHDETFRHMLGFIQGRVYYNLLNWYRVLALLPGYTLNRRFMEQMMGVKEPLPDGVLEKRPPASFFARVRDAWGLLGVSLAFVGHYVSLRKRCDEFFAWLRETLGAERPDFAKTDPYELAAVYHRLERRLITRWDAPLINDLFTMIFFGALRALCKRWCADTEGTLQNALVSGEGGMISAQPAVLVAAMAAEAANHSAVVAALSDAPLAQALAAAQSVPTLYKQYLDYLEHYGDRTTDELKLESPTLRDDPLMLLRSIGRLAARPRERAATRQAEGTPRAQAEQRVAKALRGKPFRSLVFAWVLRNARERIVTRENLRFERTRLFGRVRSIFVEIGRKFSRDRILDDAGDIFYLEVNEVLGYIEGTATCADLASLANLRKSEFDRYRALPPPPDRFQTRGMVDHATIAPSPSPGSARASATLSTAGHDENKRVGLGCCPGIVRGQARVVTDPRNAALRAGEVLVAERTDPGWVMLFPSASGLLVERGSLLSHSAIVAREMRIPAVVSLEGVTQWLHDGDWVELDGSTGIVTKLGAPPTESDVHAQ